MARRYSGHVRIYITYQDFNSRYRCRLVTPDGARTLYVNEPAVLRNAVDSPQAYTDIAHSALSFAQEDDEAGSDRLRPATNLGISEYAWLNEDMSGWRITTKCKMGVTSKEVS